MKNRVNFFKIFFYIFIIIFPNLALANEFELNATKLESFEKGNLLKGSGGIQINDGLGLIITGEKFEFDKIKSILKITKEVLVKDKSNGNIIKSDHITLYKKLNTLVSKNKTIIELDSGHSIESSNITFNRNLNKIFSDEKTLINDFNNNKFNMSDFNFSTTDETLKANNVKINDSEGNTYEVENIIYNMKTNEILGKDLDLNFNSASLKSNGNEPRLKGNAFFYKNNIIQVTNGVFTTCKKMIVAPLGF